MWIVRQNSVNNCSKTDILVRKKNKIKEEQYGISQREYKVKKNRNIMKRTKRGISSKQNKEQKERKKISPKQQENKHKKEERNEEEKFT